MKKIISAVSAAAVMLSTAGVVKYSGESAAASDGSIKIMCIGDSITDGYASEYTGSYRKFIYHNLSGLGYNIDMVGSKSSGGWYPSYTDNETGESFEFDNDNSGYSGYSISSYSGRIGIYETLKETGCLISEEPDIVTLQIGTNDVIDNHEMDKAGERLEELVDYILDNISADSVLFVSAITPLDPNRSDVYDWFGNYRHSDDWQIQYTDEEAEQSISETVESYNRAIRDLVEKKQVAGRNVAYADVGYSITNVKEQLFDGVHPNDTGYKAMGESWSDIIDEYIRHTSSAEETTSTEEPNENEINAADLVRFCRYLNGLTSDDYTEADGRKYDLTKDGRLDAYDLVLMRQKLLERQ